MTDEEIAKATAETVFAAKDGDMDRDGWLALETMFQRLHFDVVQSAKAVYEASGPNAVCAYVIAVHEDTKGVGWGICPDCEQSVPTYPGSNGNICLICWGEPLKCKCGSYAIDCDFRCEDCGEELKEGRF